MNKKTEELYNNFLITTQECVVNFLKEKKAKHIEIALQATNNLQPHYNDLSKDQIQTIAKKLIYWQKLASEIKLEINEDIKKAHENFKNIQKYNLI